jgi:hypothetical protein
LHYLILILGRGAEMEIAVVAGLLAKRDMKVNSGHAFIEV